MVEHRRQDLESLAALRPGGNDQSGEICSYRRLYLSPVTTFDANVRVPSAFAASTGIQMLLSLETYAFCVSRLSPMGLELG